MTSYAGPRSGGPASSRVPLTRARVLRVALSIVDRDGVEALSMRRLGAELGVEAMSVYNHVPNKSAVLDGIMELILNEIELPADPTDWRESVREMARSYRGLALVHPNVVPLLAMRPLNTIASLRPVEVAFEIFRNAGLDGPEAVNAFRTLSAFAAGYTLVEANSTFGDPDVSTIAIHELPEDEFPRLRELAPYLEKLDRDREFEFGIDVMLAGLEKKIGAREGA